VYAGWLARPRTGDRWPAAISVGTNPTFAGERERRVEAYALDRDDLELYGDQVEVAFVERLRGMTAFDDVEALLETMADDVRRARAALGD
jgi:riboflavin kinase/FMN adenylyltransferase